MCCFYRQVILIQRASSDLTIYRYYVYASSKYTVHTQVRYYYVEVQLYMSLHKKCKSNHN